MAKGKQRDVLYRVAKFEIRPTESQLSTLRRVSDVLQQVWNDAVEERRNVYDTHFKPLYDKIKEAHKEGNESLVTQRRKELSAAFKDHDISFFDQVNALTPKRATIPAFAGIPRNWQEETLDTVNAAFKSYYALRKNGDPSARMPRLRNEWDFSEIPGRFPNGIKLSQDGKNIILKCGKIHTEEPFVFPIPEDYQFGLLARAVAIKKFTLFRDVQNMREPGRFWISIAYEIPKPEQKPFIAEDAVYVALGASSVGVLSPKGEEVIPLWRPDKHWKPKTDAVNKSLSRKTYFPIQKGSKKWRKLSKKRRTMFDIMGAQQKQDRREIAKLDLLLYHGVHLVVTELVVRSKKEKLADGSDPERGGSLGLNWQAQNTGSIAYLVEWLEEKAKEHGGSVRKHKLTGTLPSGIGAENKIPMARALRKSYLASEKAA